MAVQTSLLFFVNGKKIEEANPNPEITLLQYLRRTLRLTGSKNACNQGGCGACTVMISKYDEKDRKVRHFTVNACITLLCSIHGYAVTTVEGVGGSRNGLHKLQESLVNSHGIQCGFCTPGMVMTLYCLIRNKKNPKQEDVERALEGNLCRCTGYRPIIDAVKPFFNCPMGEDCCKIKSKCEDDSKKDNEPTNEYLPEDSTQDVIFPPELMNRPATPASFTTELWTWKKPTKLEELFAVRNEHPESKVVMGCTSIGYSIKTGKSVSGLIIDCTGIPEMNQFTVSSDGLDVGAAITLGRLENELQDLTAKSNTEGSKVVNALLECIRWIAADQVRNMATIGGHIVTADPLSDLNPLLMATRAEIKIANKGNVRSVTLDNNFFCGDYKTSLASGDVVISVRVPFTKTEDEYIAFFKQPQRRGFSYAIVNAAMYLMVENGDKIGSLRLCFGGVSNKTYIANKCMKTSIGLSLNDECVTKVVDALINDITEENSSIEKYNLTLANSFVFKFFTSIKKTVKAEESILKLLPGNPCESIQVFEAVPEDQKDHDVLGRPIPLLPASELVCGEALFIDDMPRYEDELYFYPVLSTKAHARIINVDPSAALNIKDVIEFIDHRCIVGLNSWGSIIKDEELFASEKVLTYGQMIGGILAKSLEAARQAVKLVKIEYEELKPILTIEDAIEANSFLDSNREPQERGNTEEGFKNSDNVIEGKVHIGSQDHFYMEPLSTLAVPLKEKNEMEVFIGTQNPNLMQASIARFLNVPVNRITVRHKRTGGAFGGKESQPVRVCGPAAIAASRSGKPVRCVLDKKDNFYNTGKRHPYLFEYKVGFTNDGRIVSLFFKIYCNAGFSCDLTQQVMINCTRGIDNGYFIPNFRVEEFLCRTNTTSNTAFRGFGVPQAVIAMETVIQEVAIAVGKTPEEIREMHLYKEGDTTLFGVPQTNCNLRKCWSECKLDSKYDEKRKEVEAFNRTSKFRKRGITLMPESYPIGFAAAFLNQGTALIHVYLDGSVSLAHGGCEMGQGLNTKMIQIASRALGVPIGKIYTKETSTDTVANASASAASSTSDIIGAAVYNGCTELKERLQGIAEENPNASWEQVVMTAYFRRISLSVVGFGTPSFATGKATSFYYSYGTVCTVVEIDCLTGEHQVLNTSIVMDVGKSLNPAIDVGQIEGGFVQGYGMVTMEQIKLTPDGVPVCSGPLNYKIPGVRNIPREFRVSLLKDSPNTKAVYSSKGIGEPPLVLAMSVFIAIKEAILSYRRQHGMKDNFTLECPATSERIRMACEDSITEKCQNCSGTKLISY